MIEVGFCLFKALAQIRDINREVAPRPVTHRGARRLLVCLLAPSSLLGLGSCPLTAQSASSFSQELANPRAPYVQNRKPFDDQGPFPSHRQFEKLNVERQRQLVVDTAKLLKLVEEFNAGVQQGKESDPHGVQMRRLAEIAKLARSVREKMTYGLGGYMPGTDPLAVPPAAIP